MKDYDSRNLRLLPFSMYLHWRSAKTQVCRLICSQFSTLFHFQLQVESIMATELADFIQADSLPSQIDSTSVRIDQALSSKVKLFFRFSDVPSSSATRSLSVYKPEVYSSKTYTLGATTQLRSNISDEFRLGYSDGAANSKFILDSFGGAQPTNIASALGAGTSANAGGLFDFFVSGTGTTVLSTTPASGGSRQWNVTDTLAWLHGRHQLKVGFDFRSITSPYTTSSPDPQYIYTSENQIIANQALEGVGLVSVSATPVYREFSAFWPG